MQTYLVKYSPEIGTKSKSTKEKFTRKLKENIVAGLKNHFPKETFKDCTLRVTSNHIILAAPEETEDLLKHIAGIKFFTPVEKVTVQNVDEVVQKGEEFFREKVKAHDYFAVRCKKTNNTQISQREIEKQLGEKLVPYGKVKLDNPDITCWVEIRGDSVYFYDTKVPGMEGAPIGVQGRVLNMFSGGIDSPVASWMIYRTGLDQDFLYFDLGSQDQKENARETFKILKRKWGVGAQSRFIEVNFLPCIEEILKIAKPFQNLVLKYFFYKAADSVAKLHKAKAIVTGESIGQVSTQTLKNLAVLDQVSDLMVVRPLSTFTKGMITDYATHIGTFDASYKGREFCALAGKNVVTDVKYDELMKVLEDIDTSIIDQMVEERRIFDLNYDDDLVNVNMDNHPILNSFDEEDQEESELTPQITSKNADIIIDLSEEKEGNRLFSKALNISFEESWQEYLHWDPEKTYFLVCEIGSKSKILAHHMYREGFQVQHLEGGIQRYLKEKVKD